MFPAPKECDDNLCLTGSDLSGLVVGTEEKALEDTLQNMRHSNKLFFRYGLFLENFAVYFKRQGGVEGGKSPEIIAGENLEHTEVPHNPPAYYSLERDALAIVLLSQPIAQILNPLLYESLMLLHREKFLNKELFEWLLRQTPESIACLHEIFILLQEGKLLQSNTLENVQSNPNITSLSVAMTMLKEHALLNAGTLALLCRCEERAMMRLFTQELIQAHYQGVNLKDELSLSPSEKSVGMGLVCPEKATYCLKACNILAQNNVPRSVMLSQLFYQAGKRALFLADLCCSLSQRDLLRLDVIQFFTFNTHDVCEDCDRIVSLLSLFKEQEFSLARELFDDVFSLSYHDELDNFLSLKQGGDSNRHTLFLQHFQQRLVENTLKDRVESQRGRPVSQKPFLRTVRECDETESDDDSDKSLSQRYYQLTFSSDNHDSSSELTMQLSPARFVPDK